MTAGEPDALAGAMSAAVPLAPVLGAILAGGRARRFGSDKAMALLDGAPLLAHAAHALGSHVAALVLCGRRQEGFTCLADRPAPDMGPLGGLNAALHHAEEEGFGGVLSIGCDMPVLPPALARALIGDRTGAAVAEGQHLLGYWPAALAPVLDRHLSGGGDRSIRVWMARVGPRTVTAPALPNINTPDDLRRWQER